MTGTNQEVTSSIPDISSSLGMTCQLVKSPAVVGFRDQHYSNKSVAIQIHHDAELTLLTRVPVPFPHLHAVGQFVVHLPSSIVSHPKDNKLSWPLPAHPPSEKAVGT